MPSSDLIARKSVPNPFPSVGTLSLEDLPISAGKSSRVIVPLTYPFAQVAELRRVCQAYLHRFPARSKDQGMSFLVLGDHGTGKTHTLADVLFRIAADQLAMSTQPTIETNAAGSQPLPTSSRRPRRPFLLYAKAMGSSMVTVCQDLLGRLSAEEYRQLGLDALEVLATPDSTAPNRELVERFLTQLTAATVWRERSSSLRLAKGRMDDFPQAYSYLLAPELGFDPTLSEAARNWLTIREVSEVDRKKLGVGEPLASAEDAVQSVHFLAMLCGLADRPLVVVIDQCERLTAPSNESRPSEALRHLHSLVEILPRENCLLLLAGTSRAWQAFPTDLQQRLKNNVIPCDRLSLPLARNVLALYLGPIRRQASSDDASDEDLRPFTPGAVKELLERGGGMLRQLIQIASRAFDINAAEDACQIDAEAINKAAGQADVQANDPASVRSAVRNALQVRALPFRPDFELDGHKVDFAVLLPSGEPRLLIEVSRSAFLLDETDRAGDLLRLARAALGLKSRPLLIPIFAGYASPEVLTELEKVTHAVIVYDADAFKDSFDQILSALPEPTPHQSAIESPEASTDPLLHRIDRIEKALELLAFSRQPVHQALERGLESQGQRQAGARQEERRREATVTWMQERSRIEGQIKRARNEREANEIVELTKLRDAGEAERRLRADLVTIPITALAVLIGVILAIGWSRQYSRKTFLESEVSRASRELEIFREYLGEEMPVTPLPGDIDETQKNISEKTKRQRELASQAEVSYKALSKQLTTAVIVLQLFPFAFMAIIVGVVFVVCRSLSARHLLGFSAARTLAAPVATVSDLRSRAQQYTQRVIWNSSPASRLLYRYGLGPPRVPSKLLSDVSPHFRYAAVVALQQRPSESGLYPDELISALRIESSSVLRWALASAVGETWQKLMQHPVTQFPADLAETAYWVEAVPESPKTETKNWPKHLRIVYELNRSAEEDWPNPAGKLTSLFFTSREAANQFAEAYESGNVLKDLTFLARVSDVELREAIKVLSPLDEGGLGRLHRLKAIEKIDQLYLLFCQARWYMQMGDLLLLSNETI